MTELAIALNVPFMVVGEVGFVGEQTVFNLKFLDVEKAAVLAREGGMVPGADKAPDLVRSTTQKALQSFFDRVSPTATKQAQAELESAQAIAVLDLEAVHGVKASMAEVHSPNHGDLNQLSQVKTYAT